MSMRTATDKIRILLIDDNPVGLYHHEDREDYPWLSKMPRSETALSDLFDLRWIATPIEAREYRDLSRLIGRTTPTALEWLPEIVVIDYMLVYQAERAEDRLAKYPENLGLSPLPLLRKTAAAPNRNATPQQPLKPFPGAKGISEEDSDYGCFAGGMILALFADHPCVPVTITGHDQETIEQRMTGFFEWLLSEDTGSALHAEARKMDWLQIVRHAAPRLRERIKELARSGSAALSLQDMLALSEGHELDALVLETKYGVRRLPIAGLFCDRAPQHITAAQSWATDLLTQLLCHTRAQQTFITLRDALKLSDLVWSAYLDDDRVRSRLELGNLIQIVKHNKSNRRAPRTLDRRRLEELWGRFSTKPLTIKYITSKAPKLDKDVTDIRIGDYSNLSRRWACLMLLVRLLQMRSEGIQFVKRCEDEIVERRQICDSDKRILGAELQEYEVYLAWFPVSSSPVDLAEITSRGWKAVLDRAVEDSKETGVSLRIADLLHGRGWQAGDGQRKETGERELLHWYALSLSPQFPRSEWDEQARRVLLGGA